MQRDFIDQKDHLNSASPRVEGARILVVENDPDFGAVLELALLDRGYEVRRTLSVPEGRSYLSALPPDLVITDVRLPGRSGLDLLFIQDDDGRRIPLIVMSAFGSRELRQFVEMMGAPFLERPFAMEVFLARTLSSFADGVRKQGFAPRRPHVGATGRAHAGASARPGGRERGPR